jgi:hypothetical protein
MDGCAYGSLAALDKLIMPPLLSPAQHLVPADGLGLLVGVIPVCVLHLLDLGNVLLLRLLDGEPIPDSLVPGVVLGLALRSVLDLANCSEMKRETHLEVEHARLGGRLDVLAGGDLVEGCVHTVSCQHFRFQG